MNPSDIAALCPLLALAGTAVAVMLAAAFRRSHKLAAGLTLAGLAASGASLAIAWPPAPHRITPLLVLDRNALFYIGLMIAAAFAVALFAYDYLAKRNRTSAEPCEEFYILLTLATTGAAVLVASIHLVSFFLGLELLSVSLYALVAYPRGSALSVEAGAKYLILAGASAAFLLFGMGLVYADFGTMEFARIGQMWAAGHACGLLTLAGIGMILVGIGFKLSLVPFHLWAPDIYQGAPAPVTAFVATVSKGAVLALVLRFFGGLHARGMDGLVPVFTLLALVSMFAGNWLALLQTNVKRILAYSSIAHMGYLLVAFLAAGPWAPAAVACYLTAYFITTLGAFGVVSVLSTGERDADSLEAYRGLAWRRPGLAGVFSVMLLSLAGIPLTAGFVGKFYVLAVGVHSGLWLLVGALAVNSAIGLFYYLRVMVTLYRHPDEIAPGMRETGSPADATGRLPCLSSVALLALTLALLWMGSYPSPVIRAILALAAR